METYSVRNKEGILLMQVVGKPAEDLVNKLRGEWRVYQPKNGKRTVCYELDNDSIWESSNNVGAFKMYLWAGTTIIKE